MADPRSLLWRGNFGRHTHCTCSQPQPVCSQCRNLHHCMPDTRDLSFCCPHRSRHTFLPGIAARKVELKKVDLFTVQKKAKLTTNARSCRFRWSWPTDRCKCCCKLKREPFLPTLFKIFLELLYWRAKDSLMFLNELTKQLVILENI